MLDIRAVHGEVISGTVHLAYLVLCVSVVVFVMWERFLYACIVTFGSALPLKRKPSAARSLHGYAAMSLVQTTLVSVIDLLLAVGRVVADIALDLVRASAYILALACVCTVLYTLMQFMQPVFTGFEYVYNSAVGPFVRDFVIDPVLPFLVHYMHPVLSLYNAVVYLPSAILNRAILPYVGGAITSFVSVVATLVDVTRLLVLGVLRYVFMMKHCADYAAAVVSDTVEDLRVVEMYSSISPSGSGVDGVRGPLSVVCMENVREYRVLDLQSPVVRLRAIYDPVVTIADDFCGVGGVVMKMLMSPLLDNQLAYGVHNLANAFLVLLFQVPVITYDRCRMYKSPAIVCVPDFEPVFDLLHDGLLNVGRVVDNFFDATLLALEELFQFGEGTAVKCETYKDQVSAFSVVNSALFGTNMTVNVRHGPALMSVTDGFSVQFHGFGRSVTSLVCDGCWPFTVDPRLGIAAVQYDESTVLEDHGESTTSLFGCRCVDGAGGISLECTVATYNQDVDNTRVIPIVFAMQAARRFMRCSSTKISIQSVRWPATRLTSPGWTDRPFVEGMPRACTGPECLDIDAAIYLMPMCHGTLVEACTDTFRYAGCVPYCMGLHVRGAGTDPIVLHSAEDWSDHVQLNRMNCVSQGAVDAALNRSGAQFVVADMGSGDALVRGTDQLTFFERGVMPLTVAYSAVDALGAAVATGDQITQCVFDASTVTYARKNHISTYEPRSTVRLAKQPFAFAGDVALTSETVNNQHYVHVTRIYGSEFGEYTVLRSATMEAFAPPETLYTEDEPTWSVGAKVSVPYSWEQVPYNSVPATATKDSVFYVENPHMDMYRAFFNYCSAPDKISGVQFIVREAYSAIRIWRLRGVYCGSSEACALVLEKGLYVNVNSGAMFSGELSENACYDEFAVKVTHMEYVNEFNIMVNVLYATPSNLDAVLMEPRNRAAARYEVVFLNPDTMQLRTGQMFEDPNTNVRILSQQDDAFLCPAMRRMPNFGSVTANTLLSSVETARLVVRVLLVVPTFADSATYGYLKQGLKRDIAGHTLMRLGNGADLFSNERIYTAVNRASSLFWRSITMVVKYAMVTSENSRVRMLMQPFADVMNAAALYGDATTVPIRGSVAIAMQSVPLESVVAAPRRIGSIVNGLTSPLGTIAHVGVHPIAIFQFMYGIFSGIVSDLVFQRFTGLWLTVRKNIGVYDTLVVSRQKSACAGLSLAFGIGSALGQLVHHQCVSAVHTQSGIVRGLVSLTTDLPSIVCMCEDARNNDLDSYIRDVCMPAAPDDLSLYMIAFLDTKGQKDTALNELCNRMLDSLEYDLRTLFDRAFASQLESAARLSSSFSEFFGGDACDDYANDQYTMVMIPEPVDYFRMCMFTPLCKIRCNYTVSEFERMRDALVAGPVQVDLRKIVQSRFFYINDDSVTRADLPFKILSLYEPWECVDECHSQGTRARCMHAVGWTGPQRLSVAAYCMPLEVGVGMYPSRDLLKWEIDLSLDSLYESRALYGFEGVGVSAIDIPEQYRDRYSLAQILDVQMISEQQILVLYEGDLVLASRSVGRRGTAVVNVVSCELVFKCKRFHRVLFLPGVVGGESAFLLQYDIEGALAPATWHIPFADTKRARLHTDERFFALADKRSVHCLGSSPSRMCDRLLFIPRGERSGTMYIVDVRASGGLPVPENIQTVPFVFSSTLTDVGAGDVTMAQNLIHAPLERTYLDLVTMTMLVARDPTKVQFWLESLYINTADGKAFTAPAQPANISISIRRDCDINSCSGCASLQLQRLCYQAQQCAIRKCLGSPVHVARTFCNFGLIAAANVEHMIAIGHSQWLMVSETVSQVIVLPLRRRSGDVRRLQVTWPEDAFYEGMCEAKDISAALMALFASTVYTVSALTVNDIPFGNVFYAATAVDSEANVDVTMSLVGMTNMLYQVSLLPHYTAIAAKNIFVCDSRALFAVVNLVTGMSMTVGSDKERLLGSPTTQCLPAGYGSVMGSGELATGRPVQQLFDSLFDSVSSLATESILNKMLHPVDAMFTYAIGVITGVQDFIQNVDRDRCVLPDFDMRSVSQCSCGDHAASISSARIDSASSAYWCTGTLYMSGVDGDYRFVYNPYSFGTLRAVMEVELDAYLACVSSGQLTRSECEKQRPRLPELERQRVSTISVFTRCRTNYNMRQWDEGAYAYYDADARELHKIPIPKSGGPALLRDSPYETSESIIETCLRNQGKMASGNAKCLELFMSRLGDMKLETFFSYTMIERSGARINSAMVDACNVFSGIYDLESVPAVFARCSEKTSQLDRVLPEYDAAGAIVQNAVCEIPHIMWSGNSKNRVGVANLHATEEYDREHRLRFAAAQHLETKKAVADFFSRYLKPGENGTFTMDAVEGLKVEMFSSEGDALHQMFDCMFLGPYARMDMWSRGSSGDLDSPVYFRDAAGGLGRKFDLPCSSGRTSSGQTIPGSVDKLQGDYNTPMTCGSDARRSIIKYYVRDVASGSSGDKQEQTGIVKNAIYAALRQLREAWEVSDYGCACPGAGFGVECCETVSVDFDSTVTPDTPETAVYIPSHLRISYESVPSTLLASELAASIGRFVTRDIFAGARHRDVFTKYSTTHNATRYKWPGGADRDGLFRSTVPLRTYQAGHKDAQSAGDETGEPFTGGDTLWHMCTGLVSQVVFTMPLSERDSDSGATRQQPHATRDTKLFDTVRASAAFVGDKAAHLEGKVNAILRDAFERSPLAWHYAVRHVPSDSVMCEDYADTHGDADRAPYRMRINEASIGGREYTSVVNASYTVGVSAMHARAPGTINHGCFCDWFHATKQGTCQIPSNVCYDLNKQFVEKVSRRVEDISASEAIVLLDICNTASNGEYVAMAYDRIVDTVLRDNGLVLRWSDKWHCPALHDLTSAWGIFTGNEEEAWLASTDTAQFANTVGYSLLEVSTRGRSGVRIGSTRAYVERTTNIRETRLPTENSNARQFAAQRMCERSVRSAMQQAQGSFKTAAYTMIEDMFPVAQGISESVPVAYCLRFALEHARLQAMSAIRDALKGSDSFEAVFATQSALVLSWRTRCSLQVDLVSKCSVLGVFDMVPSAGNAYGSTSGVPPIQCPYNYNNQRTDQSYQTPGCIVYISGSFYDPCRCGKCSVSLSEARLVTTNELLSDPQCRLQFDVRNLTRRDVSAGVWSDPNFEENDRNIDAEAKNVLRKLKAWRETLDRPFLLDGPRFYDGVLRDGGVGGSVGNTLPDGAGWGAAEGVLMDGEAAAYCDTIADWWPANWVFPVGFHVTVPCGQDETAFRVFDASYVVFRDPNSQQMPYVYYSSATFRNKTLAENYVGAAGECSKDNVDMPLILANIMSLCTREAADIYETAEDPSMPFKPRDVHVFGPESCSPDPFTTPWSGEFTTGNTYAASIGQLHGLNEAAVKYPSRESDLFYVGPNKAHDTEFDPWYGCAHAPLFQCNSDTDCTERLFAEGRGTTQMRCTNGVCSVKSQDGIVFECYKHDDCAHRDMMCAGDGRCSKSYMHVVNHVNESIDVQVYADSCLSNPSADKPPLSSWGGSAWENVPDILPRHGLCAFRNWNEYYENVIQVCRQTASGRVCNSDTTRWKYSRDNDLFQNSMSLPDKSSIFDEGILRVKPHACDRDYMHMMHHVCPIPMRLAAFRENGSQGPLISEFVRDMRDYSTVMFTHRLNGTGVNLPLAEMVYSSSSVDVRSALGMNNVPYPLQKCSDLQQCILQDGFTIHGQVQADRMVLSGNQLRKYTALDVFSCGPFRFKSAAGCVLDHRVLPMYNVFCEDSLDYLNVPCQNVIDTSIVDGACNSLRVGAASPTTLVEHANSLATKSVRPWLPTGTFQDYLQKQRCVAAIWSRFPNSSGIYHFSNNGVYEYPFAWWVHCTVLSGVRASATENVACEAWDNRFGIENRAGARWMTARQWLRSVQGVYTDTFINEWSSTVRANALRTYNNAIDGLIHVVGVNSNVSCINGREYRWDDYMKSDLTYVQNMIKVAEGFLGTTGGKFNNRRCASLDTCTTDGNLEYINTENDAIGVLRGYFTFSTDLGATDLDATVPGDGINLFRISDPTIVNEDSVELPAETFCEYVSSSGNYEDRIMLKVASRNASRAATNLQFICAYTHMPESDPLRPTTARVDPILSLGGIVDINVCSSGVKETRELQACNLIDKSRSDQCAGPWRDFYSYCTNGRSSTAFLVDNKAGAICHQADSSCFRSNGRSAIRDARYISIPKGVEVRVFKYVGSDVAIQQEISSKTVYLPINHPIYNSQQRQVPFWAFCPLPPVEQEYRTAAPLHKSSLGRILDTLPKQRFVKGYHTWSDDTFWVATVFLNELKGRAPDLWSIDIPEFYETVRFYEDFRFWYEVGMKKKVDDKKVFVARGLGVEYAVVYQRHQYEYFIGRYEYILKSVEPVLNIYGVDKTINRIPPRTMDRGRHLDELLCSPYDVMLGFLSDHRSEWSWASGLRDDMAQTRVIYQQVSQNELVYKEYREGDYIIFYMMVVFDLGSYPSDHNYCRRPGQITYNGNGYDVHPSREISGIIAIFKRRGSDYHIDEGSRKLNYHTWKLYYGDKIIEKFGHQINLFTVDGIDVHAIEVPYTETITEASAIFKNDNVFPFTSDGSGSIKYTVTDGSVRQQYEYASETWQSISIQLQQYYTCTPECENSYMQAGETMIGLYKCYNCTAIPRFYCVGYDKCGYRFPFSLSSFVSVNGQPRDCGDFCWVRESDVTADIYPYLASLSVRYQRTPVATGLRILAWLLHVRLAYDRGLDVAQSTLFHLEPMAAAYLKESESWVYRAYLGGSVLSDYENQIPSTTCNPSGGTVSKSVDYTQCYHNGQLVRLRQFVESSLKERRFPVLRSLEALFLEISRDVLLKGMIPAWAATDRSKDPPFVSWILDPVEQCTKRAGNRQYSVCYVDNGGQIKTLNPWVGGALQIEKLCDTVRGQSGLDTPSATDPYQIEVDRDYTSAPWDTPFYYDVGVNEAYEKLTNGRLRTAVQNCPASNSQASSGIVDKRAPNNVCATFPREGDTCTHRQGMLGGYSGEKMQDLYSKRVRLPDTDVDLLSGIFNRRNVHLSGDPLKRKSGVYGLLRVRGTDIGGHRVGLRVSNEQGGLMYVHSLGLEWLGNIYEDATALREVETNGAADSLHWLRAVVGTDIDATYDVRASFANLTVSNLQKNAAMFDAARDGESARRVELKLAALAYPLLVDKAHAYSSGSRWICPLLRRSFYSNTIQYFRPLAPNPLRSAILFRDKDIQGLHPTMRATEGILPKLMRYKTMNGFCVCRESFLSDCLINVDLDIACGLRDTIRSLYDSTWRNATDLTTRRRDPPARCLRQIDWPFVRRDSPMRDGGRHMYNHPVNPYNGSANEEPCAILDRLRDFQYRYVANLRGTRRINPLQTTLTSPSGDCHFGRAYTTQSTGSLYDVTRTQGKCRITLQTANLTQVTCTSNGDPPTESVHVFNRESFGASVDTQLAQRKQFRRHCRSCSHPPPFRIHVNGPVSVRNASSFGVAARFSAARMLLRNIQSAMCIDNGTECRNSPQTTDTLFKTEALSNAPAFMNKLLTDPAGIFHSVLNPTPSRSTRAMLEQEDMPDDSYLWNVSKWIVCDETGSVDCNGNMPKEKWMNHTSRFEQCSRSITEYAGLQNTISNLNICDLHSDLNKLCVLITESMRNVFKANCHAAGMCLQNSFFYQPSAYAHNNKQFVRSTVREFYERYAPQICTREEETTALLEQNSELVKNCPATKLEPLKDTVVSLRTITRTLVTLTYRGMMLSLALLKVLVISDQSAVGDISTKWQHFVLEAKNLLVQIAVLAYDAIFNKSPVGEYLKKLVLMVCEAINVIYVFVHRDALCAIATLWKWLLGAGADASKALSVFGLNKYEEMLRDRVLKADSELKCMRDLPSDYKWRNCSVSDEVYTDSAADGVLPAASRCWMNTDASIGYSNGPVCSGASTCRRMSWSADAASTDLVPCALCPSQVPEGFTVYGCDTLTKQCSCMVQRPVRQQCASNAECILPGISCIQTDGTLTEQYGDAPCTECSQPVCVVDGGAGRGYCTCIAGQIEAATCSTPGEASFPGGDAICLSQMNTRARLSAQYTVAFEELVYVPCRYTVGELQYCYAVEMALFGYTQYLVVSHSFSKGRRLLVFENHTELLLHDDAALHWGKTMEPCRSTVPYVRSIRASGGVVDPVNAHVATTCIARRAALNMTVARYRLNASILPDTTLLGFSDFVSVLGQADSPLVVLHELFARHPTAIIYFATRFEPIRPYANAIIRNAAQWTFATIEMYHKAIQRFRKMGATDARVLVSIKAAETNATGLNLSHHYDVYLNGTWSVHLDASASGAYTPRVRVRRRVETRSTPAATHGTSRRRLLTFAESTLAKNRALIDKISDFALTAVQSTCDVLYKLLVEVARVTELVSLTFDGNKTSSTGAQYVPPSSRAGGRLHDIQYNLEEMRAMLQIFDSAPATLDANATVPQTNYTSDNIFERAVRTVLTWPVVSHIRAATLRMIYPSGEESRFSISGIAKSLVFCEVENIITCKNHKRDVVIWGVAVAVAMSVVIYGMSIVVPAGCANVASVVFTVAYIPIVLWLTTGYALTCVPMVPSCALDDIIYYTDSLIARRTNIATNLQVQAGCLASPSNPYDPACLAECQALGFEDWEDTAIWAACSVWQCQDVAETLETAAQKTQHVILIGETLQSMQRKAVVVYERMECLAQPQCRYMSPEAHTTCFWITFVRVVPVLSMLVFATTVLVAVVPTFLFNVTRVVIFSILQTLVLVHTPNE